MGITKNLGSKRVLPSKSKGSHVRSARKKQPKKTPRTRKPPGMSPEEWQIRLRREFGREQKFKLKNIGDEPVFSEFLVRNPETGGEYRVAVRGTNPGDNYCSCPDFEVNTLGTCKHIEFTLAKLERKRGGKKAFAKGFTPLYSEVYLRYGAKREIAFRAGRDCSVRVVNLAAAHFDENGILKAEAYSRFHQFLKKAGRNGHELHCYQDALSFVAEVRSRDQLAKRVDRKFQRGVKSPAFGKLLKTRLYSYQRKGALFAAGAGRSIIADDMGLGKTVEAIAATEILAGVAGVERVLVISPTSLKYQWKSEIEKFSGRDAAVVEGPRAKRRQIYASDSFYKITNYDVIHRDLDLIQEWAPDLVILDEAQRIKNWKTRRARSVKKIQSDHAMVLTGTPLENRLEELHSIVQFVDRFRLGPSFRFLAEHQHVDETGRVIGYKKLSKVAETLKPILIRRTKDEVLKELPERLEKKFFVPMTDEQMKYHNENGDIVIRIVAKWRRYGFLSDKDQRRLMIALQNMRMSCNSTYLLDKTTDHGVKADEVATLLDEILEDPEAKVVIFSQWVLTHNLIVKRLAGRRHKHVFFHGGVPSRKRKDLIARFKEDSSCRIFLSTDAGGVGLNLQNASAVLNMDLPWNPAVLEQRIGRVHRLGQHRPVRVVHFIAQGTIEHGMLDVLKFKKSMFAGVLDGGQDEVFLGGTRLTRFMESVENVTGKIPHPMPAESSDEEARREGDEPAADEGPPSEERPDKPEDAWADVLSAGVSLLEKLSQAVAPKGVAPRKKGGVPALESLIERDERTGRDYLRIPVPQKETLDRIADMFRSLAGE